MQERGTIAAPRRALGFGAPQAGQPPGGPARGPAGVSERAADHAESEGSDVTSSIDIRLDVGFFRHEKTLRLEARLGHEGITRLLRLWTWAAEHRPKGNLDGLAAPEIEALVGWSGAPGELVRELVNFGWIDDPKRDGTRLKIHDWPEHQEYVVKRPERRSAAKLAAAARWERRNAVRNARDRDSAMPPSPPLPSPPFPSPPTAASEAAVDAGRIAVDEEWTEVLSEAEEIAGGPIGSMALQTLKELVRRFGIQTVRDGLEKVGATQMRGPVRSWHALLRAIVQGDAAGPRRRTEEDEERYVAELNAKAEAGRAKLRAEERDYPL